MGGKTQPARSFTVIALTEAAEFGDVGDFISQYGEHGVRRTLGRVLDGPVLPADEDPNSDDPRNRLFEFVIASKPVFSLALGTARMCRARSAARRSSSNASGR